MDIGPQYSKDGVFKAAARLQQSRYRASVLGVPYNKYGNRLEDGDAQDLLNYFEELGVRESLRGRFPGFSRTRDADMLRSEHLPFNLFAPLGSRGGLAADLLHKMVGVRFANPPELRIEWAPTPAENYLGDRTSFDAYFAGSDTSHCRVGVGIEVKYTERGYRLGSAEAARVNDPSSAYWDVTRRSSAFHPERRRELGSDELRQIWRNHLLGLALVARGELDRFITVTIYPAGNEYISTAMRRYRTHLAPLAAPDVVATTLEEYVDWIPATSELVSWKNYLRHRYLGHPPARSAQF